MIAAETLDLPLVIVGKDGKVKGRKDILNQPYLIVDDVVSSYSAAYRVRDILGKPNCLGVIAYIFRGEKQDPDFTTYFLAHKEVEV